MWCTQHVLERPCVGGGPPATRFTVRAATPPWAAQTTSWLSRTSPLTKRAPPSWRGSRRPASEPAAAAREALRAARRGYRSLKRLARRKVTRFVLGWRVSTQLGNELRGGAKGVDARDALARVERPGVEQGVRSSERRGGGEGPRDGEVYRRRRPRRTGGGAGGPRSAAARACPAARAGRGRG